MIRALGLSASLLVASLLSGMACAEEVGKIADTSRIVAIGGPITEIMFAMGQEERLVARDSTSVYPAEATKLPDVGYMRALSPEGVLSVNPSGLLVVEGSGPQEALDVLKKASVSYVTIPDRYTHDGIVEKVRAVGKAIGEEAKAEELATNVDADLSATEKLTAGITERKRVLFILSTQGGRIMAAGGNSAADGIIHLAGAVNAVEGFEGYKALSEEAALAAKPDVILMMDRGHGAANPDELFKNAALAQTPAGKDRKLIVMEGAYLLGFGPRTASAARDLATALYGDKLAN